MQIFLHIKSSRFDEKSLSSRRIFEKVFFVCSGSSKRCKSGLAKEE